MAAFMIDGIGATAWTIKLPTDKPRISFPIPGDSVTTIIEQDFIILFDHFTPTALNTIHSTLVPGVGFSDHYLVEETPLNYVGGGVVRWTMKFSKVPANRSEYETFAYNWIGFVGSAIPLQWATPNPADPFRERFTRTVLSRTDFVYYLPGIGGGQPATVDAITLIPATTYYVTGAPTIYWNYLDTATTPTRAAYAAMVAADIATPASYSIVAEDSRVHRWLGNIYERSTRYVKAI